MKLKNKIILIQGRQRIADLITLAECCRINTDRIVLLASLRYPQFLPVHIDAMNPNQILENIIEVLEQFSHLEQTYTVSVEYANAVLDREDTLQVVEGNSMNMMWLYNVVKTFHKGQGHTVIDVKTKEQEICINDVWHPWETALELLKCHISLG